MANMFLRAIEKISDKDMRTLADYTKLITDPIDEFSILLESQQGRTWNGNLFYILKYLKDNKKYNDYKIAFVSKRNNVQKFVNFFELHGIKGVEIVARDTDRYIHLLATSKYLITDTAFPTYFIKRDAQIVWNVWHGTPFKAMGRKDHSGVATLGNIQKNLALADFLSFPSEYMEKHMLDDYMLNKIYNGTVMLAGYPRNTVFFDQSLSTYIPENDNYIDKRRYAYLPTWRPLKKGYPRRYASAELIANLIQLDRLLTDDEVMFVNIHQLDSKNTCLTCFEHIKPFPSDVETYAFLSTCDALVTDYSSVLFDFAITKKPIYLFTWDEEDYLSSRGMYLDINTLPFERVSRCDELITLLRSDSYLSTQEQKNNFEKFIARFCKYESANETAKMCDKVILGCGDVICKIHRDNGRENVLIYAGNMSRNGITRSITDLMSYIVEDESRNYFLVFYEKYVRKNAAVIEELPEQVQYIPYMGKTNMTFFQKAVQYLYTKTNKGVSIVKAICNDAYKLNLRKRFGFIPRISAYIQFNGYDDKEILQYGVDASKRSIIFAHNDMLAEKNTKGNTRIALLEDAYNSYDYVAVVSEDLVDVAKKIAPKANVKVVQNVFNDERVRQLCKKDLSFEEKTTSTHTIEEIKQILNDSSKTKIVTVGRFSPEKGHKRLFEALKRRVLEGDESTVLIVIGGYSYRGGYRKELNHAKELGIDNRIVMIENISNPFSIVSKCDGFILPSMYEGFGLVLFEANVCGVPIVSTRITGPTSFMEEHGGCLVDNSTDGVYDGLNKLVNREVPVIDVDYDAYNAEAVNSFYELLS